MPDLDPMAASVGALLKETQQSIAVAESACGGLISASLVAVPGASAYYVGGTVIYTRVSQKGLLLVPDEAMADMRASSEPYALLNARTVRESLDTVWGLAEDWGQRPYRQPLRRFRWPRLHRGRRAGGEGNYCRNRRLRPGG